MGTRSRRQFFDRRGGATASLVALAALTLVVPARIRAQSLELAEVERQALAASPELAAARARIGAATAGLDAVEPPGDPSLEVWGRNLLPGLTDREDRRSEVELLVVQPVRYPGKRDAARDVAAAEHAVAEAALADERARLLARVRTTFADLAAAERQQRTLAEAHDLLELLTETAKVRVGAARQAAVTILESELALDEHDLTLDEILARFLARRGELASLAGVDARTVPFLVGELPAVDFPVEEGPFAVDPEAARLALARARVVAAERRVDAARLDLRPDFGLGGGVTWREGDKLGVDAKLGMELPFFRRRRLEPRVRAAELAVEEARAALRAEELAAGAEATALGADRDRLERALVRLTGAILPRTSAALDAARAAFLNDELPFSRLLDLENDWFHARVELATLESERFAVWARLQPLLAPPPEAADPDSASALSIVTRPAAPAAEVQP